MVEYLLAALIIGLVIFFHELGHFIVAKRVKIPVAVFSIGFGPKIIGFRSGETEYRISLIPLGGYVLPAIEDEKEFFGLSVNKRMGMALGGPLASMILPVLCYVIVYTAKFGLSLANIFVNPLLQTARVLHQMVLSLPLLFTQSEQLSGIVGIVNQGGSFIGTDPLNALQFAALISLNLAVLNLLPVPVLDGGKVLLYLLEKINPNLMKLHIPLAIAGWVLIVGLTLYVTAMDIGKLFWISSS